ncbi:hypothetical protein, partial [Labrenzia sp. 011]|uniref:hypothetical protein n=1 Tax=Labrenzia sp. 011 TaxID=2171494 RepID=UPI00197C6B12
DDSEFSKKLLMYSENNAPIKLMNTDHYWDRVCFLGPYEEIIPRLSALYGKDLTNYKYNRRVSYIGAEVYGLAFIADVNHGVFFYPLSTGYGVYKINLVRGDRCASFETCKFRIVSFNNNAGLVNHLMMTQ